MILKKAKSKTRKGQMVKLYVLFHVPCFCSMNSYEPLEKTCDDHSEIRFKFLHSDEPFRLRNGLHLDLFFFLLNPTDLSL